MHLLGSKGVNLTVEEWPSVGNSERRENRSIAYGQKTQEADETVGKGQGEEAIANGVQATEPFWFHVRLEEYFIKAENDHKPIE